MLHTDEDKFDRGDSLLDLCEGRGIASVARDFNERGEHVADPLFELYMKASGEQGNVVRCTRTFTGIRGRLQPLVERLLAREDVCRHLRYHIARPRNTCEFE